MGGGGGVKNRRTSLMDDPTEYSFLCLACAEWRLFVKFKYSEKAKKIWCNLSY